MVCVCVCASFCVCVSGALASLSKSVCQLVLFRICSSENWFITAVCAWNLLVSYSFVALGASSSQPPLAEVSGRCTGSSVTLKDSAGDNLSLQTHSLAFIHYRPRAGAPLSSCTSFWSSPGFPCRFQHVILHHDLMAEITFLWSFYGNKVCRSVCHTGNWALTGTDVLLYIHLCLPTYSQSSTFTTFF